MFLFIFLITTALTLDVAKSDDSSKFKVPEMPPQPALEAAKTPTVQTEESAAAQYSEGGANTPKNETTNIQEMKMVTGKFATPAPLDGEKKASKPLTELLEKEVPILISPASVDVEKKTSKPMTEPLEKEVPIAKSNTKARKGADLATTANEQLPKSNDSSKNSTTPQIPDKLVPMPSANSTLSSRPSTKNATVTPNLKPTNNQSSTEPAHKKPLILNADESVPVPAEKSKLKKSDSHLRSSTVAAVSGHPNLVVPVTITVFALPLFAVLGYYALKHGREAWKNRHYRRMDFLLDGMYND